MTLPEATIADAAQTDVVGPPRSIVERYKASAPHSRGPLSLLVAEPQSPQIAAVSGQTSPSQVASVSGFVADVLTPRPARSLPTITVSNVSLPSTANN